MLLLRNCRKVFRLPIVNRKFSTVEAIERPPLDLSEHIAKYKSRVYSENLMDLSSIPELGNPLNVNQNENELNITWHSIEEKVIDFLGPEQVSPHYENFGMSRRVALTFVGVVIVNNFLKIPGNFKYAIDSAFPPFLLFTYLFYFYLEGRKTILLPLLNRFYNQSVRVECQNMISNYQEDMQAVFRRREALARQQLEYFDLHKEFKTIKNEAIEKLLVAEESILKQHIQKRATNLLEGARQMELQNQKKITSEVLNNIKSKVKLIKDGPSAEIKEDSFSRALDGIRNGQINYGEDLVLKEVLNIAKSEIEKVNNLSEKQKDAMLCLTDAQLKSLKSADEMTQKEFLQKKPVGLEGVFKEHSGFAKTMSQW